MYNRWTQIAEAAATRYKFFLSSLSQIFINSIYSNIASERNRNRAMKNAYTLATKYLESELPILYEALKAEASAANSAAALKSAMSDVMSDHISAIFFEVDKTLRTQLERDIGFMTTKLRNTAFRVSLLKSSRGISERAAVEIIHNETPKLEYMHSNQANRKWTSDKFVRLLVRHSLVLAYNETILIAGALQGARSAIVEYLDDAHTHTGTIVSISENIKDGVSWSSIKDEIFHPNTNAWLSIVS